MKYSIKTLNDKISESLVTDQDKLFILSRLIYDKNGLIQYIYATTTIQGHQSIELIVVYPEEEKIKRGYFKIVDDRGSLVHQLQVIFVKAFKNKIERNEQIRKLYKKEKLTQVFLARIFGLSQSTISIIVNTKDGDKEKKKKVERNN